MGYIVLLLFSLLAVLLAVSAQYEAPMQMGKECEAAFHCWRTEAIDQFGQPLGLSAPSRGKRLEIGGGRTRGGKCRCIDGRCQLFHIPTSNFFACEEF